MAHQWHRGVLTSSSWHGLEDVGAMETADDMIAAGERCGAWPVALDFESIFTSSGLPGRERAVVATYADGERQWLGTVGGFYRPTATSEWRELCAAAIAAGAKPTGAFSLKGGTRVLATFDVGGNGIRNQLMIADSYDRSLALTVGTSSIRVVCANTLSMAMRKDGEGMQSLIHTASLETKVNIMREAIGETIASGEKVRATYRKTEERRLSALETDVVFDLLFPPADSNAKAAAKTRAENVRYDARRAMAMPVNNVGDSVATIWNAATYLVDRNADGSKRDARGESDALDSLIFGRRANRIESVLETIEVLMVDGTIERLTVAHARKMGIDNAQIESYRARARSELLADIIDAHPIAAE